LGFELIWPWIKANPLQIVVIISTISIGYFYLREKETGIKLSKRYRNSIFEAQSKIFLNATQYLISGNRDLAIREFLNAVDINRETIDTYFALGGLFRSNGEFEKAISIHRSLIARQNISELTRLRALKELAVDFDKGGFVDKAIETYQDVLRINRDQPEVIYALCRIYEDIEDWDSAYKYRMMISKVTNEDQSETISHIIVQKAKVHFEKGEMAICHEELQEAFRFAPSVSAKILWLKISLMEGVMERARDLLVELVHEHPMYSSFVFISLAEKIPGSEKEKKEFEIRLDLLKDFFLAFNDPEVLKAPAVVLAMIRLLRERGEMQRAYDFLSTWMADNKNHTSVLKVEYLKLLIELEKSADVMLLARELIEGHNQSNTRHFCGQCGYNSDELFWRCPQCHKWETIQFRWKV